MACICGIMTGEWMNQPQEAGGAMPKILIVDDSPAQRLCLRQMVEQAGHEALVAESGEQALELAKSKGEQNMALAA